MPHSTPEKIKEYKKKYYDSHRNAILEYHRKLQQTDEHKAYMREFNRKKHLEAKNLVFDYYGKKCACCGEENIKFLTLDHINGDGAEQRKALNHRDMFRWIVSHDFPSGYQILCYNCNCGRAQNGGTCPHKD